MMLIPVKSYTVQYPDKEQVDLNQLLLRHKPRRWKTSGTALVLISALALSQLTGCKSGTAIAEEQTTATRKMNMAPIFEGIKEFQDNTSDSALGLSFQGQKVNVVPLGNFPGPGELTPLTEETALAIIKETLKEHGLNSTSSNKKVEVLVDDEKSSQWSFDLGISGASEPIYAEFLSQAHVETQNELSQRTALNLSDDAKEAAITLQEKLSEVYDDSTGVVFYANNRLFFPEQNLIEQVNEFVEWLKTMDLI